MSVMFLIAQRDLVNLLVFDNWTSAIEMKMGVRADSEAFIFGPPSHNLKQALYTRDVAAVSNKPAM